MQDKEFNNLMNGKDAMWALLNEPAKHLSKEEIKKQVVENATPIPQNISQEIQRFVEQKRKEKYTERAIRRMVKRKWNIVIAR